MGKHKKKETPQCDVDVHKLAQMGDVVLLKKLFESGTPAPEDAEDQNPIPVEVDAKDVLGYTAMCYACRGGYPKAVELFLEHGASVEEASAGGMRPIHHACNTFKEAVMEMLLEAGADVNAKDDQGNTGIHWIVGRGALSMMMTLLDKGKGDMNAINAHGATPLMRAASTGQKVVTAKLIVLKADMNKQDKDGNSALHYAARGGFTEITKQLLDAKCKTDLKNKASKTAAQFAEEHEEHAIAEMINERS